MRILLIGEFSRLHNSLKEGLQKLGHDVQIVGNGDGFKDFPVDFSTKATISNSKNGVFFKKGIYKLFGIDIARIEFGIRFYFHLNKFKNYDVVQLINESPIQTTPSFERFLLNKIFKSNKKVFLLCCGIDFNVAQHLFEKKQRYSILNPYLEDKNSRNEYKFIHEYLSKNHKKTHNLVYKNISGVIASDFDYVIPMQGKEKYLGLIPNPINTEKITYLNTPINNKIILFLGINKSTYFSKGISFFEQAIKEIELKYPNKVEIITSKNIPYNQYNTIFNSCHILLDQAYSFDQGYNALEAMAKGKVVFTGAETEFLQYYNLQEDEVCINALPNKNKIIEKLSYLIENPKEIEAIGKRARIFIEKEHDYIKIAEKYLAVYSS